MMGERAFFVRNVDEVNQMSLVEFRDGAKKTFVWSVEDPR